MKMAWIDRAYLLEKTSDWIRKGNLETDPYNRYFSYFVAHNILYNLYAIMKNPTIDLTTNEKNRSIKINELISDHTLYIRSNEDYISNFMRLLSKFRKEKWTPRSSESINDSLERHYINGKYRMVTRDVLRMLYKLRCNLFHGVKDMSAPHQRELIAVANVILISILNEVLPQIKDAVHSLN